MATVSVWALSAGHFSLPAYQFVKPCDPDERWTVPALSFLIERTAHDTETGTNRTVRLLFDLGLRRDVSRYPEAIRRHIKSRQPMNADPDVTKSLAAGGLSPNDIDYIIYSHVHWDHNGEPLDFPHSTFVVGNGSKDTLSGKSTLFGGHSAFDADLLPEGRTIELLPVEARGNCGQENFDSSRPNFKGGWTKQSDLLPSVMDIFSDGSVFIVDSPGHLPGHINVLAKTGPQKWVYLAGDACHDRRILRKERDIGEWLDGEEHVCCIHMDRKVAEETIERIANLEKEGVEVILSHDVEWENNPSNKRRFYGAS